MNTSTLLELRKILVQIKRIGEKQKKPDDYFEQQQHDSKLMLLNLYIGEIDREVASNIKRSERTKRCIFHKKTIKSDDIKCPV